MPYADPNEAIKYRREYNQKNREKILARQGIYNRANRERISARMSEYYKTHKDNPEFQHRLRAARKKHAPKHRAYMLQFMYGLSIEKYDEMFVAQSGTCAICGQSETSKRIKHLHVDHSHSKNKVRGLLCHACNMALGGFKENPELLKKAVAYLEKYNQ